ncbi:MAG: 6-bladed beta-propeller [candidate division Zixibacteria bacterium]|nr:6-bladed beta-propeller [candidate division Zixibacteria bacterium]
MKLIKEGVVLHKSHNMHISLLLILVVSFHTESAGFQVGEVSLIEGIKSRTKVSLSDFSTSIKYIKLETTEGCLLRGGRGYMVATDSCYIILDEKLYCFDKTGKFLNTISARGKGPGEFVEVSGFEYCKQTDRVYIFDRTGKLLIFSLNGEFVSEHRIPIGFHTSILNKNQLVAYFPTRFSQLSHGNRLIINSFDGNTIQSFLKVDRNIFTDIRNLTIHNSGLYKYQDSITIWEGLKDTAYRLNSYNRPIPKYIFHYGRLKAPDFIDIPQTSPNYRKEINKYLRLLRIRESIRTLFLEVSNQGEYSRLVYEKHNNRCISLFPSNIIENDIDDGPDFWPQGSLYNGNLYQILDLTIIEENKKNRRVNNGSTIFQDIQKGSSLDDNPIIMIVKPKL